MKGLSFNVTLSVEQMDHIAALSADKIHYTFRRIENNDKWLESKVKDLEQQVRMRDELIVKQEFRNDSLNRIVEMYKKKLEEMQNEKPILNKDF